MVLRVRIVVGAGVADRVPRYSEKAAHESFADDCFRGCCAVGVQRAAGGELLSSFRISRDRKQRAVFDESAVPTRTTRRHHQRALKLLRASEWQRWHERVDLGAADRPGPIDPRKLAS